MIGWCWCESCHSLDVDSDAVDSALLRPLILVDEPSQCSSREMLFLNRFTVMIYPYFAVIFRFPFLVSAEGFPGFL
jgi:hypothetical protein